jgi:GxxExxY protein
MMNWSEVHIETLAKTVIGCAIDIHKALGPGLLESSYKECMKYELTQMGLFVETEKPMPLFYKEVKMNVAYRLDMLVENKLVVEVKAKEGLTDVDLAQTLTYMKLGSHQLGLLINFNVALLKQGIRRVVYKLDETERDNPLRT